MKPLRSNTLAAVFALLLGSCASMPAAPQCPASCDPGTHCDSASGACVSDGAGNDLAGAALDLGGTGCAPKCVGLTPKCNATNHCVGCLADADCATGDFCKITSDAIASCTPGCTDDSRCGAGKKCCQSACVDAMSDPQNCGKCGAICTGAHSVATCSAGQCALAGKCDPGWGDCDMNPANGCEANLHVDPNNCTSCGMKCAIPNAVQACADGCYEASCTFGFDDCNMDPKDGCETKVLADPMNCGGCGMACPPLANASTGCQNGGCYLASCIQGFFDCDHNPANGCESNLTNDANNCGACGATCPQGDVCTAGACTCPNCANAFPNASAQCVNNACVFSQCNLGFADCDGNKMNGCEVNIAADARNCAGCGNICPMNTPNCSNSKCGTLFTFPGIMKNVPVNMLGGWTQCYIDTYGNSGTPMAKIIGGCPGASLLLACRMKGSQTLSLIAEAPRADVTFDTSNMGNTPHNANGVSWYYSTQRSLGFAGLNDPLSLNSCDTGNQNPDLRLCWHTGGGNINGGYRCGATTGLNGDNTWERIVYTSN